MTQIWLVDPFTKVKSAEHMAKIIQHKSQIRALKPISKCIKTLKIKYSQMRNLKIPFPSVCFSDVFLTLKFETLVLFTIAIELSHFCLTFEGFCLGLTFSHGPRDRTRIVRFEVHYKSILSNFMSIWMLAQDYRCFGIN